MISALVFHLIYCYVFASVTSEDSAGANGTRGTAARTFVFQKTIQVAQVDLQTFRAIRILNFCTASQYG